MSIKQSKQFLRIGIRFKFDRIVADRSSSVLWALITDRRIRYVHKLVTRVEETLADNDIFEEIRLSIFRTRLMIFIVKYGT